MHQAAPILAERIGCRSEVKIGSIMPVGSVNNGSTADPIWDTKDPIAIRQTYEECALECVSAFIKRSSSSGSSAQSNEKLNLKNSINKY